MLRVDAGLICLRTSKGRERAKSRGAKSGIPFKLSAEKRALQGGKLPDKALPDSSSKLSQLFLSSVQQAAMQNILLPVIFYNFIISI